MSLQRTPSNAVLLLGNLDFAFSIPRRILAGGYGSAAKFATIVLCK